MSESKLTILTITMILLVASSTLAQQDGGANQKFGPIAVHGNSVVFDPDHVLTHSELAKLGANGKLGAKPAVLALTFTAGAQQTFIFSASGQFGCCGTINIGPDGYTGASNIKLLKSISGLRPPQKRHWLPSSLTLNPRVRLRRVITTKRAWGSQRSLPS